MKRFLALLLVIAMVVVLPIGCTPKEEKTSTDGNNTTTTDQGTTTTPEEPKINDTYLIWNVGADPKTFDPSLNNASDGGHIIQNLFEGLMQETAEGLEPAQAKEYKVSEDGTVYTFILRDDIKWSDGKPVTAQDFEYTWKRVCDPETASEYSFIMAPYIIGGEAYLTSGLTNLTDEDIKKAKDNGVNITDAQFEMLKNCVEDETHKAPVALAEADLKAVRQAYRDAMGVKAIDEKTLEVKLNFPCSYFLSLTTFYTYMPVRQDIVDANGDGWEKNAATCISNGPFVLEEYQIGSHLKMKKSETYYNADEVKLAGIKGVMIVEATTAHSAYQAGEINVNETIPTDDIPNLLASDPNFTQKARVGTYYAIFNCDAEPTNDVRVRKAMALAIDRKKIVEQVTKGGQIPATGFIPPNLTYSDGSSCRVLDANGNPTPEFGIDPMKANVEEAKKLLAEAGYPDGKGFPALTFLYNTSESHQKISEALQEMWKTNLNINIELKNEEWAIFQDTRRDGNFTVCRGGWLGDYAAPMTMLDLYTSYSGNNDCQWRWNEQPTVAPHDKTLNPENKEFDEAIKKAMVTSGKEQDEAYKKAEQLMMDNMVIMPIYYYSFIYEIDSAKVEGVEKTLMGQWIFKNAEMVE